MALLSPALVLFPVLPVLVALVAPVVPGLLPLPSSVLLPLLLSVLLPLLLAVSLATVLLPLTPSEPLAGELVSAAVLLAAGVLPLARPIWLAAPFESSVLAVVRAAALAPTPRPLVAKLVLSVPSVLPVLLALLLPVLFLPALLPVLFLPALLPVLFLSALLPVLAVTFVPFLLTLLPVLAAPSAMVTASVLAATGLVPSLRLLAALAPGVAALLLCPAALLAGGPALGRLMTPALAGQVTARLLDVVAAPVAVAGIGPLARLVAELPLAGMDLAVVAPRSVALVLVALPPGLAALHLRPAFVLLAAALLALVALPLASSVVRIGPLSVRMLFAGSVVVVRVVCHLW